MRSVTCAGRLLAVGRRNDGIGERENIMRKCEEIWRICLFFPGFQMSQGFFEIFLGPDFFFPDALCLMHWVQNGCKIRWTENNKDQEKLEFYDI